MASTTPYLNELNTAASGFLDTKQRNQKVNGLHCARIQRKKGSSNSSFWETVEEYLSCNLEEEVSYFHPWVYYTVFGNFDKTVEELISTYKNENLAHNLDINRLYIKEYTSYASINLLHSIVNIGEQIFKDARPRNELEEKFINSFVSSKSKVLSHRQL